jgi:hypothetical protein
MVLPLIAAGAASMLGKLFVDQAPNVASWIFGDKTGKAVESITGIARDVLGVNDPADLEAALARDPEKALEFKRLVLEAEGQARQQALDELTARLHDVQSARGQTVELARAGSAIAWGAPIISALITIGFFVMLYLVIRKEIPEGSRDLANIMLGSLGTSFTAVVAYWVGSSAGSAAKDAVLRAAVATK